MKVTQVTVIDFTRNEQALSDALWSGLRSQGFTAWTERPKPYCDRITTNATPDDVEILRRVAMTQLGRAE
jgi:hypothetical protein